MNDIMIDIETMGTKPFSAIISIGACFFNPETGEIGDTFYQTVSLDNCVKRGLRMDPGTVTWWMNQSKEAKQVFVGFHDTLETALNKLTLFMSQHAPLNDVKPWGNGASFDVNMLEQAYETCGLDIPWKFWNIRDVRTVVELAKGIVNKDDIHRKGTHHNAVDDAVYQAEYTSAMVMALKDGR